LIICVSDTDKEYLIKYFKLNPNKIQVIENPVDKSLFFSDKKNVLKTKKELGLSNKDKFILFFGQLDYQPNVEALRIIKEKIIPIDSKFSIENYNRLVEERDSNEKERLEKLFKQDLKNRIDETAKYVKPEEGTLDFAFMFIPHEAIYYDLLVAQVGAVKVNTRDLIEYAFKERHVIIVSPTSFLAYLQTVLQGLKALQIEESAKEIRQRVEELGRHLMSYEDFMNKIGKNLGTTVSAYNSASKEFKKIDKDVMRITGKGIESDLGLLEKPEETE